MSPRRLISRLVGPLAVVLGLLAASDAVASPTRQWLDGNIAYTSHLECITGAGEYLTGQYVGYIGNTDITFPRVGDVYYAHVVVSTLGNACAGIYVHVEVVLPRSTGFEISAGNPVYCYATNPTTHQGGRVVTGCPQAVSSGFYGGTLDFTGDSTYPPGPWALPQGWFLEIQFPLRSLVQMSGIATNDYLQAAVQAIDGVGSPWAFPNEGIFIGPKPPGSRLGQGGADFDFDLKSDPTVYNAPTGLWYVRQSLLGPASVGYGGTGYTPAPGDYDWDGYADVAVYHEASGLWFVRQSSNNATVSFGFGGSGFTPVPADYDWDGRTDFAVYHQASGLWYIRRSTTLATTAVGFGGPGYLPVPKDYDGDGKTDIAVYHQASGLWFIRQSSTGTTVSYAYGGSAFVAVPRDYDGDGKADVAVYHPPSGLWYIRQSSTGTTVTVGYGGTGYTPVPADYDGDGKADVAVYHQASGLWFIRQSKTGTTVSFGFGGSALMPVNN